MNDPGAARLWVLAAASGTAHGEDLRGISSEARRGVWGPLGSLSGADPTPVVKRMGLDFGVRSRADMCSKCDRKDDTGF